MTNRLTPEALDALLAEHGGDGRSDRRPMCWSPEHEVAPAWPCTIYLLASEVRDARTELADLKDPTKHLILKTDGRYVRTFDNTAAAPQGLAHYEEGLE